jgi:hypothetical protein
MLTNSVRTEIRLLRSRANTHWIRISAGIGGAEWPPQSSQEGACLGDFTRLGIEGGENSPFVTESRSLIQETRLIRAFGLNGRPLP